MEDRMIREYPAIGANRVRLLSTPRGPALDVREYVQADTFEGFTRRGVRLSLEQAAQLHAVLSQLLDKAPAPPVTIIKAPKCIPGCRCTLCVAERKETAAPAPVRPVSRPAPVQRANAAPKPARPTPSKADSVLSPVLSDLRQRMRNGETVPMGELMAALNADKAPKTIPAPVRIDVDRKTPDGQRLGDALLSGILEQTTGQRATG